MKKTVDDIDVIILVLTDIGNHTSILKTEMESLHILFFTIRLYRFTIKIESNMKITPITVTCIYKTKTKQKMYAFCDITVDNFQKIYKMENRLMYK